MLLIGIAAAAALAWRVPDAVPASATPCHERDVRGTAGASPAAASVSFVETAPGRYAASRSAYDACFSAASGLAYVPRHAGRHSAEASAPELSLKLLAVRRGSSDVTATVMPPDGEHSELDPAGRARLTHSRYLEEQYAARADGVEQLFVLREPPPGAGDLRFVLSVGCGGLQPAAARPDRHGGVSFLGADGTVAVRYGHIVVRDAARRSMTAEPEMSGDAQITFALPERWLREARYPVVVDPLVGNNMVLSPSSTVSNTVAAPTVAAGSNSFLVAWTDYGAGANAPLMAASIVSQSGVASAPFGISSSVAKPRPFRQQRCEAAFDGANWLVVWSDDGSWGGGIRGSIITSTGTVLGGTDFAIATTAGLVEEDPLVAFNGVDYFVAWQDVPSGSSSGQQIYFTRVTTAGMVGTVQALPALIAPQNQSLLFLSAQTPSGDTLLIYRENAETPAQTRSVRIGVDGTIRDAGGTSLFKESAADNGYGRLIGVAFVNGGWQVLSSYGQTVDSSVFLHKISTNGTVTPPQGVFAEMGLGPVGDTSDSYAPAFAGTDEWLFVRNEKISSSVYHIIGKRVSFAGEDKDPIPFQIDTATTGALRDAVAAQSGSFFLVAWADGRSSTTQPGDAANVAAAIVDTTSAGSTDTALVAAISASPTFGEKPLTVSFSSALSQGSYDSLRWDFGNGSASSEANTSYTYTSNGTYIARLMLTKGGYQVYDSVVIAVGTGTASSQAARVGVPVADSTGMSTGLSLGSLYVGLNFRNTGQDSVSLSGLMDTTALPADLTGVPCSVWIGSKTVSFTLDVNGGYKSDAGTNPVTTFALTPATGHVLFQLANGDLRDAMVGLGATNADVKSSDQMIISVPVSLTVSGFSASASCGALYTAVADNTGNANYIFQKTGTVVSGSCFATKFAAKESTKGTAKTKVHTFAITGQLILPNAAKLVPASDGSFDFAVGNYGMQVSSGLAKVSKGAVKLAVAKAAAGLSKFTLSSKGVFTATFVNVPAESPGGSGLPVANSGDGIVDVDLNLSLQFDLSDGSRLSAGFLIPISRQTTSAKSWKLGTSN
ncbi:MAG: PKD domain-containing protein [Planctomycetota bacterium]|nr:PKD domain-containing protein [Planctomycetota bacterium]